MRADPNNRRLVYVVNSPGFFVSHRLALAVAARDAGWDVTVACLPGEGVDAIRAAGLAWVALPLSRRGMNPLAEAGLIGFLVALYRRLRPAVVHHITIKPVLWGTVAARLAGVPRVVNAVSGMGFLFTGGRTRAARVGRALYRACLRHPDMTVIVQNAEDRALFEAERLAPPASLTLIPGSGVDLAAFHPAAVRARPPIVIQVSRMLADKGVREFIAAAAQLRPAHESARFVLVGAPDPGNPSTLTVAELETAALTGAVEWWGERGDIAAILADATIFVLPSYREGLPKALIEAAAAALPLVSTDTSGCREVVRNGVTGLLVPVADAPSLGAAIATLLADPARAAAMGRAARADAEARFGLDHIIAAQLALYAPARIAPTNRSNR